MKNVVQKYFRPEVLRQKAYGLKSYSKVIKLNQNELPYDLPLRFKQKLFQRLKKTPFQIYPHTQPDRLAKRLGEILGVASEQILISNGSNVMIQNLMISAAVKGKVMSLEPGFSLFEEEAGILGNRYAPIYLNPPDFELPLKNFIKKMKQERPKIIFIANPHAPTGTLFSPDDILEIIRKAECPVVVDEAYYQFAKVTLLPKIKKYPQLIILRTLSKGFGLGGVRVGFMVAQKPVVEEVKKVTLPYCLPILSEEVALLVLEHRPHFQKIIREVLAERERVFAAMRKMQQVECYSSHANFILFRVKNAKACFQHLLKKGLLVRDMSNKPRLEGCLRVSIGRRSENDAFLRALKTFR